MRHASLLGLRAAWAGALLLCATLTSTAQELNPDDYCHPLQGVSGYLSANFGEMRENHFHSGVDFKTDGAEGKRVVAVADGYVSRIFCSHAGYGRALYLNHPNGTTSVYGHLQRFTPEIEAYLASEQLRRKSNRADIWCDSTLFRFRQGDEIGRSGNSGTSYGPHLHFEIRSQKTGKTLNPLAAGLFRPKDQIPPYIFRLHYIEVDSVRGVPIHSAPQTYEVLKVDKEHYQLKIKEPVKVGHNGYFVLEASDRKDDVSNTFGIYRLRGLKGSECWFEYRIDAFSFDRTRYCNAVSYYPLQGRSRNEVLRLVCLEENHAGLYHTLKNRGIISLTEGEQEQIELLVEDDCGNCSRLRFRIIGKAQKELFCASADSTLRVIHPQKEFRHREGDLTVTIAAGTLYEPTFYRQSKSERSLRSDSTLIILSPTYRILEGSIPLHKSIRVGIDCFVPLELRKHVCFGRRSMSGKRYRIGGRWEEGAVRGNLSSVGEIFVAADTLPPRITARFKEGANLEKSSKISFRVSDNFAGINSLYAYIDGAWSPVEYHAIKGTATLRLGPEIGGRKSHAVTLIVEDGCGNQSRLKSHFIR